MYQVMKSTAVGPRMRMFTTRMRQFSAQSSLAQSPIIFVKNGQTTRTNSLLGPADRQFPFPGDVTHTVVTADAPAAATFPSMDENVHSLQSILASTRVDADANYLHELQQVAVEEMQQRAGDWPIELTAQECPRLLKKDLKQIFPDQKLDKVPVTVLNLTQKSKSDMSAWSREMEEERDELTASFIASGQAICNVLKNCGYWADFVDPSSGRPYLGQYSNYALFETDDVYKYMGFRIEDLGCCKVLKHLMWGTNSFVGTLFTDAPMDCQIVKDILAKVNDDEPVEC